MTLYEIIKREIDMDDYDTDEISADLVAHYSELNEKDKKIMDGAFFKLTGHNFSTLVKMYYAQNEPAIK